jgi:hypothetical protein
MKIKVGTLTISINENAVKNKFKSKDEFINSTLKSLPDTDKDALKSALGDAYDRIKPKVKQENEKDSGIHS